jgi:hypothetical protein
MIDVVSMNEDGTILARVDDESDVLQPLLPPSDAYERYPFLATINPYGDTYFNSLQSVRLFREWEYLERACTSDHQREFLARVKELLRRCNGGYLYVKFIGE